MRRIRVIIADDHAITRQGTRQLLQVERDIEVVAESDDGNETLQLVLDLKPDILLLDISMPGRNGIEVAKLVRQTIPETRIIVLTGYDNPHYERAMLQLGVQGYLSKTATSSEIAATIRSVHVGRICIQTAGSAPLFSAANLTPQKTPTPREMEVLALVAEGCRNRDIASRLGVTERTIHFHLSNLFAKLGVSSRTELIHLARQTGWLLLDN